MNLFYLLTTAVVFIMSLVVFIQVLSKPSYSKKHLWMTTGAYLFFIISTFVFVSVIMVLVVD